MSCAFTWYATIISFHGNNKDAGKNVIKKTVELELLNIPSTFAWPVENYFAVNNKEVKIFFFIKNDYDF